MNPKSTSLLSTGVRLLTAGLLASLLTASSFGDDARGKQLYTNCVACHKEDGSGQKLLNAPAIAGLSEKYVTAQLEKFKAGHRGTHPEDSAGMQMRPMTLLLTTPEDVAAVSKYVASLEPKPAAATITDGDAERGKMLYMTCQACHGANGEGNDMLNSPALTNQYDWYLDLQLHNFKKGIRGANPEDITGSQMRPMAMTLADDQAIKDVVAYIQSLSAK